MGRADAAREWIYQHIPGLGKAPEIRASESVEGQEAEPINVDVGEAKITKRKLDAEGNEISPDELVCEDSTIADQEIGLFAVADGVGSGGNGDVASRIATEQFHATIKEGFKPGMGDKQREELMRRGLEAASAGIVADKSAHPDRRNMDSTFTGFLVDKTKNGPVATIAHIGDSRAYHFDPETETLEKLTRDDSVTEILNDPIVDLITPDIAQAIDQSTEKGQDVDFASAVQFSGELKNKRKELKAAYEKSDQGGPKARQKAEELWSKLEKVVAISRAYDAKLGTLRQGTATKVEPTAGRVLFELRNLIFGAVGDEASVKNAQVKTINVKEGSVLFNVSDGIGDVLTEDEMAEDIASGLKNGMSVQEIFAGMAKKAADSKTARQKTNKNPSTGETVLTDDISISGARVELGEAGAEAPVEELSRRADDETPAERAVEVAYDDQEAAQLKSTIAEYENAKGGLELAEQAVEKYRVKLEEYGENSDNPDFSKVALLKMNEADLSDLAQKYVGPDFSNKDLERLVKEAKLWARKQIGPREKFKSVDELVKDFEAKIQKYKKNLSTAESSIGMYKRTVENLRPEAELARINLLKAKAERPELIEDGDQVTMEFQGVPTRFEIRKVKGKDLFLEPIGKDLKMRPIISLDGSKGREELGKLKEALRAEAEAAEAEIEKAQLEEARAIAK